MNRRQFLMIPLAGLLSGKPATGKAIMTVNGPIPPGEMGLSLIHEHFLVDFIGADKISNDRWEREAVVKEVLPYLMEAKNAGVKTIFDCTPAFLGRDVALLQRLASQSGLNIITNTGYYGASNNKYLPSHAFTETARQLAKRWVHETKNGIDETTVKPGFIKIGIDVKEPLSDLHEKLIQAAAITHLETGLTICSHTGLAKGAFQQIEILKKSGVDPGAFVWVHAQVEKDHLNYVKAAKTGAWVSLDGMGWGNMDDYVNALVLLKNHQLLHKALISHDAGWYKPGEPGASFVGYTAIFSDLLPRLKKIGFSKHEMDLLLVKNPAEAFHVRVRRA